MRSPGEERWDEAGSAEAVARIRLLSLVGRDLLWARNSITGRSVRAISQAAGCSAWLVALAEGAGISGSDVIRGAFTVQVLQGQVRVRHDRRDLTASSGDLVVVPDHSAWLAATTDFVVVLTGVAA